ncbi:sialidase family protein [Paludisphaera borealis]|uniref:Sialidase domain-containing protein n=1 Tax=Paludisphaera borealis TaxID=1387353 RepID=A0A1U7CP86_9BACT|nr:sialidase family protein [Paludisphaera borealis]APW60693.1 putative beta-propeller-type glycoside hydrolase of unknown function [Paludisphaera borealis]
MDHPAPHRLTAPVLLFALLAATGPTSRAGTPGEVKNVVVYAEPGRFAGWPANHGIWSWGDEILVGFSRGWNKDRGPYHHIDKEKAEEHLLARSLDGGLTWKVEQPQPPGALTGSVGMRHGLLPDGPGDREPVPLTTPLPLGHPDFAMTLRMEGTNSGASRLYYSTDRGRTWDGPFRLPLMGRIGVMARTDYIVTSPSECLLFLTASKTNGKEGRPFCAETTDAGLSWQFVSYIGPEPTGYAIMPSTVALSPTDLVTTIRRLDAPKSWIEAYASHDRGRTWTFLNRPEPDTGEGNPPALLRLPDGRLCLLSGRRVAPFGIRARLSNDQGKTWGPAIVLRDDGGGNDVGYPRAVVRKDGAVVVVYYFHDRPDSDRYLAATIWKP